MTSVHPVSPVHPRVSKSLKNTALRIVIESDSSSDSPTRNSRQSRCIHQVHNYGQWFSPVKFDSAQTGAINSGTGDCLPTTSLFIFS